MNISLKTIKAQCMEGYTYTDSDGDNNRGVRLNEDEFARRIIQECLKVTDTHSDHRIRDIDLDVLYSTHFGIKL